LRKKKKKTEKVFLSFFIKFLIQLYSGIVHNNTNNKRMEGKKEENVLESKEIAKLRALK